MVKEGARAPGIQCHHLSRPSPPGVHPPRVRQVFPATMPVIKPSEARHVPASPRAPACVHLRVWDDRQIAPGTKWREAIETALAEAKVTLLLVSHEFLDSEFVMNVEVPKLLAAAEADGVRVLWACLSPCLVEDTTIH